MATTYATSADLAIAWRALTSAEEDSADFWLPIASAIVRAKVSRVDARIADGTLEAVLVQGVVISMVKRALQNVDGVKSSTNEEAIEDYRVVESRTLDAAVSAGALYMTADEIVLLSPNPTGKAFSIVPGSEVPTCDTFARIAANRAWRDR